MQMDLPRGRNRYVAGRPEPLPPVVQAVRRHFSTRRARYVEKVLSVGELHVIVRRLAALV